MISMTLKTDVASSTTRATGLGQGAAAGTVEIETDRFVVRCPCLASSEVQGCPVLLLALLALVLALAFALVPLQVVDLGVLLVQAAFQFCHLGRV